MIRAILCFLALAVPFASSAASSSGRILVIVTGEKELTLKNDEKYKTGYWLEEFTTPYQLFEKNGFKMTIATPNGNRPSVDPASAAIGDNGKPLYWPTMEELNKALIVKKNALDEGSVVALSKISDSELDKYDAVFFPGGHGPMEDLMKNKDVARVLAHFHKKGKPTALVCHAPISLLSTKSGGFLYKGYKVTAFTDAEEAQTAVGPKMKTTPEKELKKAGAFFVQGSAWQPYVVEDRELITGQNPASSKPIAETLIKHLKSPKSASSSTAPAEENFAH